MASLYHLPYAAKHIGLPRLEFFPEVGKSILSFVLVSAIGFGVKSVMDVSSSWLHWFAGAVLTAGLGFVCNLFLILHREERQFLLDKIGGKLGRLLRRG